MRQLVLFALALPCLGAGKLELFHAPQGAAEQSVQSSWDMGATAVSDNASVRFRIRNTGDGPVTLTLLDLAGAGFSLTGAPSRPFIVSAGSNVDFTVTFRPPDYGAYSGNLRINSASYLIRASSLPALTLFYNDARLESGATIDVGRVERGTTKLVRFELRNTTSEAAGVSRATVSGPAFSFLNGPPTPWLQPGQAAGFEVQFRPSTSGIFDEVLTMDRRQFRLTGAAFDPPTPRPALVLDSVPTRSAEQGRVSVRLAEASKTSGSGKIRLELRPSGQAAVEDAAAQFVSGSRTAEFTFSPGDTAAWFGKEQSLVFQTGTTAGIMVLTVEAGGFTDTASIVVSPEPVRIDRASAVRNGSNLEVSFSGFDNTRTVSEVAFTFYLRSGQTLGGMPVRASVTSQFERWWPGSKLGGVFAFKAAFPVTGDIGQIGAVDVEIRNASGTSSTQRLTF